MTQRNVLLIEAGHQAFTDLAADDIPSLPYFGTKAANVPGVTTGGLVLLSDVITALGTLQASHNDLLDKLKAAGLMVPD